jgi:hypothetical protein
MTIPPGTSEYFLDSPLDLESTMSKNTQMLPRSLYRWSVVLLPILALVLSACGTGGSTGGVGY